MPTITTTVHQVLRYFFVGALAVTFVATPPGEGWSVRFASFLTEWLLKANTQAVAVAIAMLIGGSLVYAAHRVIVYPVIFRFIILRVLGQETTEPRLRRWWPYGRAVSGELHLEQLGPRLLDYERDRFNGWASEVHLCYLATEIALFTLCIWPGWPRVTCPWAWGFGLLVVVLPLVAAWDLQAVSVLVHRATNPVPK